MVLFGLIAQGGHTGRFLSDKSDLQIGPTCQPTKIIVANMLLTQKSIGRRLFYVGNTLATKIFVC